MAYTIADLNTKVNENETLLEFIRNSEEAFGLEMSCLEILPEAQLNAYIDLLDDLWNK